MSIARNLLARSMVVATVGFFVSSCAQRTAESNDAIAGTGTDAFAEEDTLAEIRRRGFLRCGINGLLTGFSETNNSSDSEKLEGIDGTFFSDASGFDADFCRVIATAIFGDPTDKIKFLPLTATERFEAVRNDDVDILFRNSSATAGRELELGQSIEFGPTIFYDRQSFLVKADSTLQKIEDFEDVKDGTDKDRIARICVTPNTTMLDTLRIKFDNENIEYLSLEKMRDGKTEHNDNDKMLGSLGGGHCNAIINDVSGLLSFINSAQNSDGYRIFDEILSRELLSPYYRSGDTKWRNIIRYSIYATIEAMELGKTVKLDPNKDILQVDPSEDHLMISKDNIEYFLKRKNNRYVEDFLGRTNEDSKSIGTQLGLSANFAANIITHVGNYDDIYEKNLEDTNVIKIRGPNQLWSSCDTRDDYKGVDEIFKSKSLTNCGLLISPPFTINK